MSLTFRSPLLALVALCAVVLAGVASLAPPSARASADQRSIMMDDDLLVYRDDATRDAALTRMKGLGVDTVRVTVLWSVVADGARATPGLDKRFRKLGADDPRAYPKLTWDRYDRLVRSARALGVEVYFDVTGPGPSYAHETPPKKYKKDAKWWRPKPREFYKFVQAVGKRYSGTYRDENDGRQAIPRVSFWALWNEPNQGGWLRPQWLGGKPVSPAIYRELYLFGHRALVSTGHGNDTILVGETAPRNVTRRTTTSAMGVRTFATELLCGPGHKSAGCSSFAKNGPIQATAWAHHPYTRNLAPNVPEPDKESITLANINDLGTLLDGLSKTGNVRTGLPLMSTEFGYETNAPDPYAKVTPQQQADYTSLSEALTFYNPRILATTQFLLRDVKPVKGRKPGSRAYWSTYQSGLFTAGGTPKPAAQAYAFPFVGFRVAPAADGRPQAFVFGQLRFRPNAFPGQGGDSVQLQFKPADGSSDFVNFDVPQPTNARGYFAGTVVLPGPGQIRAMWSGPTAPFSAASLPSGI